LFSPPITGIFTELCCSENISSQIDKEYGTVKSISAKLSEKKKSNELRRVDNE